VPPRLLLSNDQRWKPSPLQLVTSVADIRSITWTEILAGGLGGVGWSPSVFTTLIMSIEPLCESLITQEYYLILPFIFILWVFNSCTVAQLAHNTALHTFTMNFLVVLEFVLFCYQPHHFSASFRTQIIKRINHSVCCFQGSFMLQHMSIFISFMAD
jgi:hypothetical protein